MEKTLQYQIDELLRYVSFLDKKIDQYERQGRNTEMLQKNKTNTIYTILELEQYQSMNEVEKTA